MRAFRPEGYRPNCCVPRVLRLAQDYFSHAQWLVILAITTSGPKDLCVQNKSDLTWRVRGMSYGMIAARAGVCWKTARNAIRRAVALGLVRVFERTMQGKRRVSTTYIVESFTLFLAAMRAKPEYFHTADGHVVGVGRSPQLMTVAVAQVWKINPNDPPAPRSAGPISSRSDRPRELSTEDIERIIVALGRVNCPVDRAGAKKAIETAQHAYIEAGCQGEIDAMVVEGFILEIGRAYKPNAAYPTPRLGYFLKAQLPNRIKAHFRPRARTG